MRRILFLACAPLIVSGCATTQLAFTSIRQIGTEPDIYVDQVIENLARASADPTAMTYFTLLQSGVPSVADKGTFSIGSLMFPAQSVVKQLHRQRGGQVGPLGVERDVGSNWTISPINDPNRLGAMRYLYLWVLGKPINNLDEANALLRRYASKTFDLAAVPRGWVVSGRKRDMPKGTCRSFCYRGVYYWVVPGMEEHLTRLTMTMLQIATSVPSSPQKPAQTVVWSKINPVTGVAGEITVTRTTEYDDNRKQTVLPSDPVKFTTSESRAAEGVGASPPANPAPPAGMSSGSFMDNLNNYTNPIISPGLFSQPRF